MATYYFDSSGIVKYYISERGSQWVTGIIDAQTKEGKRRYHIAIAQIGIVEVAAAIAKRQRMGQISKRKQETTFGLFSKHHRERYTVLRAEDITIELATELTQHHPLRAYDAVQLATALLLNRRLLADKLSPLTFVSADDVLCQAALAEGLPAENPNEYE
jgi:predicted nucleic acid-binding protein